MVTFVFFISVEYWQTVLSVAVLLWMTIHNIYFTLETLPPSLSLSLLLRMVVASGWGPEWLWWLWRWAMGTLPGVVASKAW